MCNSDITDSCSVDGSQQFTIEKMFYIFHETFSSLYFERLLYYCIVHGLLDRFVIYT